MSHKFDLKPFISNLSDILLADLEVPEFYESTYINHLLGHLQLDENAIQIQRTLQNLANQVFTDVKKLNEVCEIRYVDVDIFRHLLLKFCQHISSLIVIIDDQGNQIPHLNLTTQYQDHISKTLGLRKTTIYYLYKKDSQDRKSFTTNSSSIKMPSETVTKESKNKNREHRKNSGKNGTSNKQPCERHVVNPKSGNDKRRPSSSSSFSSEASNEHVSSKNSQDVRPKEISNTNVISIKKTSETVTKERKHKNREDGKKSAKNGTSSKQPCERHLLNLKTGNDKRRLSSSSSSSSKSSNEHVSNNNPPDVRPKEMSNTSAISIKKNSENVTKERKHKNKKDGKNSAKNGTSNKQPCERHLVNPKPGNDKRRLSSSSSFSSESSNEHVPSKIPPNVRPKERNYKAKEYEINSSKKVNSKQSSMEPHKRQKLSPKFISEGLKTQVLHTSPTENDVEHDFFEAMSEIKYVPSPPSSSSAELHKNKISTKQDLQSTPKKNKYKNKENSTSTKYSRSKNHATHEPKCSKSKPTDTKRKNVTEDCAKGVSRRLSASSSSSSSCYAECSPNQNDVNLESDLMLTPSQSDSSIRYYDMDKTKNDEERQRMKNHMKQLISGDEFQFCISYIRKLYSHLKSMEKKIKLSPECCHCPLHCFSVLDSLSKHPVGRPAKTKNISKK